MKKLILAAAVLSTLSAGAVNAAESELTFNAGVVSDYRYRGLTQTRFDPAIQVGADYAHSSGFYAGTWMTNISWIKDAVNAAGKSGKGDFEWDLYGGYAGEFGASGLSYDVGGLYYYYPSNNNDLVGKNANTFEVYAKVGYGPLSLKYSHATTNLFGAPDSKNSGYWDLSASHDFAYGIGAGAHVGYQNVRNGKSYTDWKLGVSKKFEALKGLKVGLDYVGTDLKLSDGVLTSDGKNSGKNGLVLSVSATF